MSINSGHSGAGRESFPKRETKPFNLLINPEDVKKEFEKLKCPPMPSIFRDQKEDDESSNTSFNTAKVFVKQEPMSPPKYEAPEEEEEAETPAPVPENGRGGKKTSETMEETKESKKGKKKKAAVENKNDSPTVKPKKAKMSKEQKTAEAKATTSKQEKNGNVAEEIELRSSTEESFEILSWLLHPLNIDSFLSSYWEKRPAYIQSTDEENPKDFSQILSTAKIDKMLRDRCLYYGKNLDITSYKNEERLTLNPEGRAFPTEVWDFYNGGCSIRLLNPQIFSVRVWRLLSMLQEYFGCFVGANVYLTPAGTQGFAPHFDDIEAFILQLEGKKEWRLYNHRSEEDQLARISSPNLTQEEIGEPFLTQVLHPGDVLYFPRGTIHQARSLEDTHSLHLTLSCYQKNSFADFLEKAIPVALDEAINEDVEFRRGLPIDFLQFMGTIHSDRNDPRRTLFMKNIKILMKKVIERIPFDSAADQIGKEFIHSALPPSFDENEMAVSVLRNGSRISDGKVHKALPLGLDTEIRLTRANILRVIPEEEDVENELIKVYHYTHNSREYHADDPQFFYITPEESEGVEHLVYKYPSYVKVNKLPMESAEAKVDLANKLWKKGVVFTSKSLDFIDE